MKLLSNFFVMALIVFFVSSCQMITKKKDPVKATPNVYKLFSSAKRNYKKRRVTKALKQLDSVIAMAPTSDVADDAFILKGEIYYKKKQFNNSYQAFLGVINSDVFSPEEAYAMFMAAKSLTELDRFSEAASLASRAIEVENISIALKTKLFKLRFKLSDQLGDRLDVIESATALYELEKNDVLRNTYKLKSIEYVYSVLTDDELDTVASKSKYGIARGYAAFKLGEVYYEKKEFSSAKDYLEDALKYVPNAEYSDQAQHLIDQISARRKVAPFTIGAVLPLTGKHSKVAQRALRGLQLGLGVFGEHRSDFTLAVQDSQGNPERSRAAVEKLVVEDHVIAIVGSIFSKTARAVAMKSDELGVPNITLSQKARLTELGEYVFRNSVTSEMIVKRLVHTAMKKNNIKKFAILYPNDQYGVEYSNYFWREVVRQGGEIVGAQPYSPKETDFNSPIKRLVGTFYVEDRITEYRKRLQKWRKEQKKITYRVGPPRDILPPIVDFEALFIPDNVRALGQIAPTLPYHDISNVKLIGTNLWNNSSLVRRGKSMVENAIFVDGLLLNDPRHKNSEFYKKFKRIFHYEPGILEVQAYDIGLLLRQVISQGERSRTSLASRLKRVDSFPGAIGRISMNDKRELIRPLFDLTVLEGSIIPAVDSVPVEK